RGAAEREPYPRGGRARSRHLRRRLPEGPRDVHRRREDVGQRGEDRRPRPRRARGRDGGSERSACSECVRRRRMADQTLNCEGLNCPMPIVKIAKALKKMDKGQTLEVTATDPAFEADIHAWSKRTKNPLK